MRLSSDAYFSSIAMAACYPPFAAHAADSRSSVYRIASRPTAYASSSRRSGAPTACLKADGPLSRCEPGVRAAPSKIISDLKDLHVARTALIKDRTAAKNREKNLTSSLLKRHVRQRLSSIGSHLKEIEAAIRSLINADDDLRRKFAILVSIPGIAARSAFALLIDMPELGTLEAQEAAALSGTAPMTRQSGKRTGKAFVSGGRVNVRQALYMPALVAARFNPDLKDKYQDFTARGKPPKVALTAIMRKLVILANALERFSISPGHIRMS
jgi:transposase